MKRIYWTIPLLSAVLLVVGTATALHIEGEKDRNTVTETVLFGDKSVAHGIQMTQAYSMDSSKLVWESTYTVGESLAYDTEFEYYVDNYPLENIGYEYIEANVPDGNFFIGSSGDLLAYPMSRYDDIARDIASRTANGTQRTEEVYLIDYYTHYPIKYEIQIQIDGEQLSARNDSFDDVSNQRILEEYFNVPTAPDTRMKMTVKKAENGDVVEIECEVYEYVDFYLSDAVAVDGAFYVWANAEGYGNDGKVPLPFENKIHRIDMEVTPSGDPIITNIIPVYTATEGVELLDLQLRTGEQELLVLTREEGQMVLTILALPTMEEKQRLVVDDDLPEDSEYSYFYQQEDFLVIERGNGDISLILQDETGYTFAFDGNYYTKELIYIDEVDGEDYFYLNEPEMDYKDGKLAIIIQLKRELSIASEFYLAVLSEDGMEYMGRYDNSIQEGYWTDRYEGNATENSEREVSNFDEIVPTVIFG